MFPGKEAVLSQVVSISVECLDCGRTRWRRLSELRKYGVAETTKLSDLSRRLSCSACVDEGSHGKHISVSASFATTIDRERAEAHRLSIREVPSMERYAKDA